jgi:PKD repeat protein
MTTNTEPKAGLKALVHKLGLFLILTVAISQVKAQTTTADFTASVTTGCVPLTVNFTNLSAQANAYFWDFGNGNTSTLQNPTTVYLAAGTYTVRLIAINTVGGGRDTMISNDLIFIDVLPIPDFTATPVVGCSGSNSIQFINQSQFGASYTWDFGDGTYSTDINPLHNYSTPGVYTVKLIAANADSCTVVKTEAAYITIHPKPSASFIVNQQSTCDQNQVFDFISTGTGITNWFWDFGDGNTSQLQSPSHTYSAQGSFTVSLIVANQYGCTDTMLKSAFINIGAALVPTFTVNNQSGCLPFAASFNSTVAGATSWLWDFGDGTTSALENPTHVYNSPGVYDVSLSVTTITGCNGSVTQTGYITAESAPVADFVITNPTGCTPHTVGFVNNSTGAASYLWSDGNGQTSTDSTPAFTFTSSGNYNITLIAYSPLGCADTLVINSGVTVNNVTANISATPRVGCAPLTVNFSGSSNPTANSWFWDFGDGNTSVLQNPSHTYTSTGFYNVSLTVTSPAGCISTRTNTQFIKLYPDSIPYSVPDTVKVCLPPGTVSFADPTLGSNTWLWDFGDGGTSNIKNPSHTYSAPGVYTVTLQTTMAGGCSQTFNPFAIVEVLEFLVSPIVSLITSPCGPYTVALTNNTLHVAQWFWDFGDGNTSTQQNPVHTYAQPGTYTIQLLMTAVNGCQTSLSTTVTFGHANPIVASDTDLCLGDAIDFSLSPSSSFVSAIWNFGDGNTSTSLQPSHVYAATGSYIVSVTVVDSDGCTFSYTMSLPVIVSDPRPSFVVNQNTTGCVEFNVQFTNTSTGSTSYLWDFGNGNTSTATNPSHNYSLPGVYTVTLSATNNGCTRSYSVRDLITANMAVADFSFTPSTGCLPLNVAFTDLSINPVSWQWSFGDGNSSVVQNPVHIYTTLPATDVSLTITDINGCTRTKTRNKPNPVVPVIALNDSVGCRPLQVQFTTPTNAASYFWDFGDGNTSVLRNPSHLYTQSGIYTVTLTCTLASGCTTSTVKPNFIRVIAPVSNFMSPTVSVCAPSLVSFVNQSVDAVSWLWNFGDGTTSTNENPSHIYNIPGTYTVTLISYNQDGCSDTLVRTDYITVPGTYSTFTLGSQVNCDNSLVQFLDQSINATTWFWNFGDGYTSTQQNPVHLYADTGSYTVTLITSDNTGCSSFFSFPNPIVIYPSPDASGNIPLTSGCAPFTINFNSTTTGGTTFSWHFGNGDSANVENGSYTYPVHGIYSPYLIAYSPTGCADTVHFAGAITVYEVPVATFTSNVTSGCAPLMVSFTDNSSALNNAQWIWDFGNGLTSALQSPSVVFTDPGTYQVRLIIVNAGGCSDTMYSSIVVYEKPQAAGITSTLTGCSPHPVTFVSQSLYADFVTWHFGDGNTSTADSVIYLYGNPGTYQPFVIAGTNNGCTDTFYVTAPVVVNPVPLASFTVNQNAACSGSEFVFANTSISLPGSTYQWNIGGVVSGDINPAVVIQQPGLYDVSLIVTNIHGCSDTLNENAFIEVYDTIPPPVSPILSVSVLSASQVEILWMNNTDTDLDAYVLYRLDPSSGTFIEIFRENNPLNSSMNLSSSYVDNGLNTLSTTYTYKLQTIDRCAFTLPLDSLTAHTTINVSAIAIGNDIRVTWTPYIGCSIDSYELSRVNLVTGTVTPVATLPSNVREYLDEDFLCPHEQSYRVMATSLCGNPYTSLSDTANALPDNILEDQKVDVVRSTVVDDRDVLTEWLPPVLSPERVKEYIITRSYDAINYSQLAVVPSGVYSFIDTDVDVHSGEYYYKIEVVSDCDVTGTTSNISSSVWLQSKHFGRDDKTRLWWTPYKDWDTGVDYYIIEKLNINGQWEQIRTVGGSTLETVLDE